MDDNENETMNGVRVSMELTGEFEDVVGQLKAANSEDPVLAPLIADIDAIIETVERINGGTRSVIAENLPPGMTVKYDPEGVVGILQILERYGLVSLEGNTWYPDMED